MRVRNLFLTGLAIAFAAAATSAQAPLKLASAKVSLTGTTNVHGYTAETKAVHLANVKLGAFDGDVWKLVTNPAAVEAFDIVIPAASLKSTKDGIDKNMHKALNVTTHQNITFSVKKLETRGPNGALRALGTLTINGVAKEIALDLVAVRAGASVSVTGEYPLLMTDYGVKPPKAMMGMMKTDPKVVLKIEIVLAPATT